MKLKTTPLIAALITALAADVALADTTNITIEVEASLAPNAFGSPSYAPYVNNAIQGLYLGVSSFGTVGMPDYYQRITGPISVKDNIVTGFSSWHGTAPGSTFGAPFANELGNRVLFGIDIRGNGSLISIDQLSFNATSSDGNSLGFGFPIGSYNYSLDYRGLQYGTDGIRGTGDDIWITSGPSSQQVDEIIGRGSGNAWAVYGTDPGATDQDKIDLMAASIIDNPMGFTGTYSLGGFQGSDTVTLLPTIPEPSSFALAGIGLAGLLMVRRFRAQAS